MIGFILGTSEGRKIISLMNKYTNHIAVSTATKYGGELLKEFNIKNLNTKPLNEEEMLNWIENNSITTLVDCSHPYAQQVTKTALNCCKKLNLKYIRYERLGALENLDDEEIIRVNSYEEAIDIIKTFHGNILNSTGSNNFSKFLNLDFKFRIIHRILPSYEILKKIIDEKVQVKDIIAMQGPICETLEIGFINQYNIKAIVTKDSGVQGGVLEKLKAVKKCNIKLIVIEKPKFKYDLEFNDEEKLVSFILNSVLKIN